MARLLTRNARAKVGDRHKVVASLTITRLRAVVSTEFPRGQPHGQSLAN